MHELVRHYWYLFAAASGVLLSLTFYPFYLWPLCFVALVPLFSLFKISDVSLAKVFFSTGIAIAMPVFLIAFLIAIQFHFASATAAFVVAATVGAVPLGTLLYAVLFGATFVVWRLLYTGSFLLDSFLIAAFYAFAERVAQILLGGYYIPSLSHSVAPFLPLLTLAAIVGSIGVTAIIVWINTAIAALITQKGDKRVIKNVAVVCGAIVLLYIGNQLYIRAGEGEAREFKVATVQISSWDEHLFGTVENGVLAFPEFKALLQHTASLSPDLVVYPESPIVGEIDELVFTEWLRANAPGSTTIATWDNLKREGEIFTGYEYWRDGKKIGEHLKQELVPFFDYTPQWARSLGASSAPFDVVAAPSQPPVGVDGVSIGGLVCSETHRSGLARTEARKSELILAAASEEMFQDDAVGAFALASAQYRAVENNIPVVRASLIGPSALINGDGTVAAYAPEWQGGILSGTLLVRDTHPTLYNALGDTPLVVISGLLVVAALRRRSNSRTKSPDTMAQG